MNKPVQGQKSQHRGQKPLQGPMQQKLRELRNQVPKARRDSIRDPSPSPMLWKGDGEDHINIYDRSETELGAILVHNSKLTFVHNIFGRFYDMESFWHYIQSAERDDRTRTMTGQILKNFAKKLTMTRVKNFRAIIMDANYQRIKQYDPVVQAMKESTLPFDCYYVNEETGLRTRPVFFKWLIMGFEEIRRALKEEREPDFGFLLDQPGTGIYEFAIPNLTQAPKAQPKKQPPAKAEKAPKPAQEPRRSTLLDRATEAGEAAQQAAAATQEVAAPAPAPVEAAPQPDSAEIAQQVLSEARSLEESQSAQ